MNKVILTGKITKEIELKKSENGKEFTQFSIAVKRNKEEVDFIDITAFESSAVFLNKFAKKGDSVSVEGKLKNNTYEKDGVKRYRLTVVADSVELFSSNKANETIE
ncbi:MAG: single-stranded DNA-binding protein [Erysipelotrichaceae bacterium]|nr:single-stranded DNA-binding protein [Erysipelotrichaceae bacterium]